MILSSLRGFISGSDAAIACSIGLRQAVIFRHRFVDKADCEYLL